MNTKKIITVLAIISLLLLFIQPFYTWFKADDFCLMNLVKDTGIVKGMWHDYMTWDGRSISLTYPISRLGLYFALPWLGPLIGTVLIVLLAGIILNLNEKKENRPLGNYLSIVALTALIWLACFNFSSQTIYWCIGIGYNLDLILIGLAFLFIIKKMRPVLFYVLGIPVFFYAGTVSPNGAMALLFLLLLQWIKESAVEKADHKKYLFALLLVFSAFCMVVFAPGNSSRMGNMDPNNYKHIWTIYFNLKLLFSNLWNYSTPVTWMLLIIGFAGASVAGREAMDKAPGGMWQKFILFVHAHKWLFAAFISFIFFLPFPAMHSPRTNIHFTIFMVIYAVSNFTYLRSLLDENKFAATIQIGALCTLLLFAGISGSQVFDARYAKGQMDRRIQMLHENKGKAVLLTHDDVIRPPKTREFEDVSADSSYWVNTCLSEYYGLKSIKMDLKISAEPPAQHSPKAEKK